MALKATAERLLRDKGEYTSTAETACIRAPSAAYGGKYGS